MTRKKLLQKRRVKKDSPNLLYYENLLFDSFLNLQKIKGETVAAVHPPIKRPFSPSDRASGDTNGTLPK